VNVYGVIFVSWFCLAVYFVLQAVREARSPEVKREMERLREQRRIRKAARRQR
jgi:hypothetical protein